MIPVPGDTFLAKDGNTYNISRVIPQDTGGAWTVMSNEQGGPNYHKKIPETGGLEESRFAIEYDTNIPGWKER